MTEKRRLPKLPRAMPFEDIGPCFFSLSEFRAPKKGEWYASGAIPEGYRARNDMTAEYWIVVPVRRAKVVTAVKFLRGDAVNPQKVPHYANVAPAG